MRRMRYVLPCAVAFSLLSACGGEGENTRPKNPLDDAPPVEHGSHLDPTVPVPAADRPAPFDAEQARVALARAAKNAATCVDVAGPDQPSGKPSVSVTFASNGHSVRAAVPAPFVGTQIGSCVERAFVGIIVPHFEGDEVTVEQVVDLVPKAAPAPSGKPAAPPSRGGGAKKK